MNNGQLIKAHTSLADLIGGAIHVYRFDTRAAGPESPRNVGVLSTDDLARASRIIDVHARTRFIVVRSWLRHLIGNYLESDPKHVVLETGPYGKPRLRGSDGTKGLVFNATHSGDQAALAFAYDAALGIDIERWRPLTNAEAMARRCFAASELEGWLALADELREPAFFRLWTLKEAFCKAVGRGLVLGMARCVFDCGRHDSRLISHPLPGIPAESWHIHEFGGREGVSGALLIDRPFKSVQQIVLGTLE